VAFWRARMRTRICPYFWTGKMDLGYWVWQTQKWEKSYTILLCGFSKFSILIGWQAVRKKPYPDCGPYFPYLDRCPGCHMLTDSVQPYNKPIIDLACSVCTVKYQTSVFAWTSLLRHSVHTKKHRSDISQYRPHARSIRAVGSIIRNVRLFSFHNYDDW
jgi:hypothetical protein